MSPELCKTSGLLLAETFHRWSCAKKVDCPKSLHEREGHALWASRPFFFFFCRPLLPGEETQAGFPEEGAVGEGFDV